MNAQLRAVECDNDLIPDKFREEIAQFLLDGQTGNVTLNIKDGRILGIKIEKLLSI